MRKLLTSDKCSKCGSTKNLVNHHISYIPEVTEVLCKACDVKERRYPKGRGFRILKACPQRGILSVPKSILENLGDLIEIQAAPSMPVAVIFQRGLPLKTVRDTMGLISDTLELIEKK